MSSDVPEDDSTDEAWASIVANFGDRAELSDEEVATVSATPPAEDPVDYYIPFESEDGYVPPEAPRVGLADGPRGAAWLGVLGAPALFLIALLTGVTIPEWLALFAVIAFLVSLGYLISTMRRNDDDPWDDGARV